MLRPFVIHRAESIKRVTAHYMLWYIFLDHNMRAWYPDTIMSDTVNRYPLRSLKQILYRRLEKRGVHGSTIPGFIRSLAGAFLEDPCMNIEQVNQRLRYLGWSGCDMDYHTLQLAIACFEAEGMDRPAARSAGWFEKTFAPAAS